MTKFLLGVLVFVLLVAAAYFTFPSKFNNLFLGSKTNQQTITIKEVKPTIAVSTPTPTPTPSVEDDLTALDTDLADLDNSEKSFNEELKKL